MKRILVIACLLFMGCGQGAEIPVGAPLVFPVDAGDDSSVSVIGGLQRGEMVRIVLADGERYLLYTGGNKAAMVLMPKKD